MFLLDVVDHTTLDKTTLAKVMSISFCSKYFSYNGTQFA